MSSEQDTGAQKGRRQGQPKNVKRLLRKKRTTRTSADPATSSASQITCKTERFETRKAIVAHEVRALFLGGTHGLQLYLESDDVERLPDVRNRIPEIGNSANSQCKSFQKWRVFCELIRSGSRMGRKDGDRSTLSRVLTQSVLCFSMNCLFYGGTSSLSIEASGLGGAVVCAPMLWTSTSQKK